MAGYSEVKEKLINAILGRPEGTEIQPEKHQEYALSMLEYIRDIELSSTSTLIDYADEKTVPIQPDTSRVCYIGAVGQDRTVVFENFRDENGLPISVSNEEMEGTISVFLWNTKFWSVKTIPSNIISSAQNANFYYNFNIKKTYSSKAEMISDLNPIGDDNRVIKTGDIVSVANNVDTSDNGIYSRTFDGGWKFQTTTNYNLLQTLGDSTVASMSQKAISDELYKNVVSIEITESGDIMMTTGSETSAVTGGRIDINGDLILEFNY